VPPSAGEPLPVGTKTCRLIFLFPHYQAVNDALNDQVYVPWTTDPQAWCRGYLAGFAADMISWTPLLVALPDSLNVILSVAEGQRRDTEGPLADAQHATFMRFG